MPIYEFYCKDCHTIFNFFSRTVNTEKQPACPKCARPELERKMSVFAISRVAGWAAHVLEEQFAEAAPKPMLYRPESDYIGDYCGPDECSFVPLDKRG